MAEPPDSPLARARAEFRTTLRALRHQPHPPRLPPEGLLRLVRYRSPAGGLPAGLTPLPGRAESPGPAVIWLAGEYARTVDERCWERAARHGTAHPLWEAGLTVLLPSLRGGHDHTGRPEGFYGEVDDVIAAARELAGKRYVDPRRLYLAGHSTGGTLALLVAECTDLFRAVFAFGPGHDLRHYGSSHLPFDLDNPREWELRAPGRWLDSLRTPTFVFEGGHHSNAGSFRELERTQHPPCLHFHLLETADHFSLVEPVLRLVAQKIRADDGAEGTMAFSEAELRAAVAPA